MFWTLAKGHGRLRALLPDIPETLSGIEEIKRHRRRATATLLGAPPRPWRPLSTDLVGLASVYPIAWGATPVKSGHNIPAWRAAHAHVCDMCTPTAPHINCSYAHAINMLEFGWRPAWHRIPRSYRPPQKKPKAEHKAALDDTITSGLRRGIISKRMSPPRAACGTFVVDKHKFSGAAKVWDLSWATPVPQLYLSTLKHRTVFDYSLPCPVNDAAIKWPVRYHSLSYYLAELTPTSWIATEDLAHSYQQLPLSNDDQSRGLLCFRQLDPITGRLEYYEHHTAPWGFSPSGSAFMCVPGALKPILVDRGCTAEFYCDDGFLYGPTKAACTRQVAIFRDTCEELGIELNSKAQPPRQRQRFLGFMIDVPRQRITLAPERLLQIHVLASKCLERPMCSRTKLKRLAGIVTWASTAIVGSKARTVSLYAAGQRGHVGYVNVTPLMKEDLAWWRDVSADTARNGTRIFLKQEDVAWASIISDAGQNGLGAHTASSFAWRLLTPKEKKFNSQARELLAAELAISHLGPEFDNRVVVIGVDNMGTCAAINSGRAGSSNSDSINIVRRLGDLCFNRNIELLALWTRRTATTLADAIADSPTLADARVCFDVAMSTHSSNFEAATSSSRRTVSDCG